MRKVIGAPAQTPAVNSSTEATSEAASQASTDYHVTSTQHITQHGQSSPRSILPPEFMEVMVPSLKVGGLGGALGLFTGGVVSIVRYSPHPVVWSISTSIQWFALGSSYYATRLITLRTWGRDGEDLSARDKIKASAIAGGVAGATGGLIVGPRSILPGILLWSLAGAVGQKVVNEVQGRRAVSQTKNKQSWLDSSWSPMRRMTDQEYYNYLQEKILKVEAEMAVLDDNIKELKAGKRTDTPPVNR